jgi:hypothetical protein
LTRPHKKLQPIPAKQLKIFTITPCLTIFFSSNTVHQFKTKLYLLTKKFCNIQCTPTKKKEKTFPSKSKKSFHTGTQIHKNIFPSAQKYQHPQQQSTIKNKYKNPSPNTQKKRNLFRTRQKNFPNTAKKFFLITQNFLPHSPQHFSKIFFYHTKIFNHP